MDLVGVLQLVEADRRGRSGQGDVPVRQDDDVIGQLLGPLDVLLDDDEGGRAPELGQDAEELVERFPLADGAIT